MQGAWSQSMAGLPVTAVAISYPYVATRLFLKHEGKILRAHGWLHSAINLVLAGYLANNGGAYCGLPGVVDRRWVDTAELKGRLAIQGLAGEQGNFTHARFNQIQIFRRKGSYCSAQDGVVWDNVVGRSSMDLSNTQDGWIQGVTVSRDDGLQALAYLHGCHDRIGAQMGHCAMSAFSFQVDLEYIARRHDGTRGQAKTADCDPRPVMHAEYGVHRTEIEQSIVDHFLGAAVSFFGWLKDDMNSAVKVTMLGQVPSRRQKHGGVSVMAASVHFSGMLAGVFECIDFLHGQGVHVGTQTYGPSRLGAAVYGADHPGYAYPAASRDAPGLKLAGDDVRRAGFFVCQLRMRMDVASDGGNFGLPLHNWLYEFHDGISSCRGISDDDIPVKHFVVGARRSRRKTVFFLNNDYTAGSYICDLSLLRLGMDIDIKSILEMVAGIVGTIVAAFMGARVAFRLERKRDLERQRDSEADGLQSAIFLLCRQLSVVARLQRDVLDPCREDGNRHFRVPIMSGKILINGSVDFDWISHMLRDHEESAALAFLIMAADDSMSSLYDVIEARREFHASRIQLKLEDAGILEFTDKFASHIRSVCGEADSDLLERYTDQLYSACDMSVKQLELALSEAERVSHQAFPGYGFRFVLPDWLHEAHDDLVGGSYSGRSGKPAEADSQLSFAASPVVGEPRIQANG
jgi:hypothetical protein